VTEAKYSRELKLGSLRWISRRRRFSIRASYCRRRGSHVRSVVLQAEVGRHQNLIDMRTLFRAMGSEASLRRWPWRWPARRDMSYNLAHQMAAAMESFLAEDFIAVIFSETFTVGRDRESGRLR